MFLGKVCLFQGQRHDTYRQLKDMSLIKALILFLSFLAILLLGGHRYTTHPSKEPQQKAPTVRQGHLSSRAIHHIQARHWHDTPFKNSSRFYSEINLIKLRQLIDQTIHQGSYRRAIYGRKTYQYRFSKSIGITAQGTEAYSLRVVTDMRGNIITAYPVR